MREPAGCEFKAACPETRPGRVELADPQPEPPRRFRDRARVARLAAELKANRGTAVARKAAEKAARLGEPPRGCSEDDARRVVSDAVGYVTKNRQRMDYPRYRKLGLPTSSAPVESTIKRLNRRLEGTETFRGEGGGEALLTIRAAYLSEAGRVDRHRAQPRPRGRAVGTGGLRPRA